MLVYPSINPVAFHLGPLSVHWYGLSYLFAFLVCWGLLELRMRTATFPRGFTREQLSDIVFYAALGTVIGGRLGYMIFYAWGDLLQNPWLLFQVWKGGMSFHGGFLGVLIALWMYAKKIHRPLGEITDLIAPVVPIGLGFGRLANFINGELWGRATDLPWGMVFPNAGPAPRHPSQLYEFFFEGLVLFIILWCYSKKPRPRWAVSSVFLIGYGLFRCFAEFFREPDAQVGFIAFGWLTKGQLLSIPLIVLGVIMFFIAYRRGRTTCGSI